MAQSFFSFFFNFSFFEKLINRQKPKIYPCLRDWFLVLADIDECAGNANLCTDRAQTCHDTVGGYECDCPVGYVTITRHDNTQVCEGQFKEA